MIFILAGGGVVGFGGGDAVFGIVFMRPDLAALGAAGHVAVSVEC